MLTDLEAYQGIRGIPEGNLCTVPGARLYVRSYLFSFSHGMIA